MKAIDKWLIPYVRSVFRRRRELSSQPVHIMFALCDHYEPLSPAASQTEAIGDQRVARWLQEWPRLAAEFRDADGRQPCHSIFYPAEAPEGATRYVPQLLPLLEQGSAEMEVHLHHRDDTEAGLRAQLIEFRDYLHREFGILGKDRNGLPKYGFIHGNWALCNSRPDGDWCGVNNELDILRETGCYADFTFPSVPSSTQPRNFCNDLYWAKDRGGAPRSHDFGRRLEVGLAPDDNELLLVQGPVGLNWHSRKFGLIPRIENADISGGNIPTPERVDLWIRQQVHVLGRENWIFIKMHTHGCVERNAEVLLGERMRAMYRHLLQRYNDGRDFIVHFVSARELSNIARAAVAGEVGPPGQYRDWHVGRPEIRRD
ncbi:hypothetical protein QEH52_13460 [Coraliomargarita sp. SDUM461003]|uniref:Polysaccharide deacetylase n=1 Tax=Thalassobacterium maritimum TaxID=3041265 RepID=A0ABU1AWK2_9BACT|nr:hypothetical protein [Coraliomargarita sp. SDUM461003]MDQ8208526.1 hypothetical protein [Coraliomargarita sp. SDUM461003]